LGAAVAGLHQSGYLSADAQSRRQAPLHGQAAESKYTSLENADELANAARGALEEELTFRSNELKLAYTDLAAGYEELQKAKDKLLATSVNVDFLKTMVEQSALEVTDRQRLFRGITKLVGGACKRASYSTSGLGLGPHTITASYGGDSNFTASTSAAATQYVNTNLSSYPTTSNGAYNLSNANLVGGYFVGMPLAGANLTGSNLKGATFIGANLSGANLSNSNFMSGANFTNATLQNANLSNSNLKGASFTGVNLTGADFSNSNLTGATGLKTATLTNVVWSNTACPDGTNSNSDGGTCVGHL
jgi:hypothetical protein